MVSAGRIQTLLKCAKAPEFLPYVTRRIFRRLFRLVTRLVPVMTKPYIAHVHDDIRGAALALRHVTHHKVDESGL